jgi:putative transposase
MTNHYHIVVETIEGNLARGMQQLNGVYSQYFNRRHNLVGHVFQGRYKGILVQRDAYLLELTRYVVLNPVRAGFVQLPDEWAWSSYSCFIGKQSPPPWLEVDSTLALFSSATVSAIDSYRQFVIAGIGLESPLLKITHQLILGDEEFITQVQHPVAKEEYRAISKAQRRALALPLDEYKRKGPTRDEAMAIAYYSTAYTMEQIGACFEVSYKTVSRAVKKYRTR